MSQVEHDNEDWWSYRKLVVKTLEELQQGQKELVERFSKLELQVAKIAGVYSIIGSLIMTLIIEAAKALIHK